MLSEEHLSDYERYTRHYGSASTYPKGKPQDVAHLLQLVERLLEEVHNLRGVLKLMGVKARKPRPAPKKSNGRARRTKKKGK